MNKTRTNSKVKKTLVRDCEQKVKPATRKQAVYDAGTSKESDTICTNNEKQNELSEPTMCSSEMFTNYLCNVKKSERQLSADDLNVDKGKSFGKVTKKLNFHFNDKIYRNLIELNANIDLKSKRDKRPSIALSGKRDVEPNIEDFYEDIKDEDIPPSIPIRRPKFKPVRNAENGDLHQLVSSMEHL